MTDEAETNDDWLNSPALAPRAVAGHPAALQPEDRKPAKVTRLDELGRELKAAPVVAVAQPRPAPPQDDPGPSPDPEAGDGPQPPRPGGGRPKGEIWKGCPVTPLGMNGDFFYFLDRHGQLRATKAEMKASQIVGYFGRVNLIRSEFPSFDKNGDVRQGAFNSQLCNFTMIEACHEKGLFNPDGAVRGVGAWSDDEGKLIYHTGDRLITQEGRRDPGEIDGKIYPAYPPIPAPAATTLKANAAEDTLALISTWNFARPDIDPHITLGMIGVQMMGGALAWRPAFWFTGDKASGKSTLQDLIKWLHGDKGLVQSNDPTKSGITARLGHSALPVALDELEPGDEGSSKERDIITLARVASSGGQWLRGTADQKGASGNVYSTFMFSSILIPGSMGAQDRSRLITISLYPPEKGAPKPVIDPRTQKLRGATLKRILIDRWPTWAERLALWRTALAEFELDGRNGDNWATTMAMADMALNAELPKPETMKEWARKLAFGAKAEVDDIGSNAEDMLMHLLGQGYDVYRRGEQWNIAHWLMVAAQLPSSPVELIAGSDGGMIDDHARENAAKRANEKLAKIGLRVKGSGNEAELFIPNKPIPGLKKLFEHSQWASGVWSQAARRVPGASASQATLAGQTTRGVYIPFKAIAGLLAFPMDRSAPDAAPPKPADWDEFA
jgi:hypothetical protein